ncbi:MAG: hypothetical protein H7210_05275 [Pyrinomonadaceae bacterium]|nr:hypothetical protein [Phycisphaerales bacterium]
MERFDNPKVESLIETAQTMFLFKIDTITEALLRIACIETGSQIMKPHRRHPYFALGVFACSCVYISGCINYRGDGEFEKLGWFYYPKYQVVLGCVDMTKKASRTFRIDGAPQTAYEIYLRSRPGQATATAAGVELRCPVVSVTVRDREGKVIFLHSGSLCGEWYLRSNGYSHSEEIAMWQARPRGSKWWFEKGGDPTTLEVAVEPSTLGPEPVIVELVIDGGGAPAP